LKPVVIPPAINQLFTARNWQPFDFQRASWAAYLAGKSGLIHAPTGLGKTWAAWLGPLIEAVSTDAPARTTAPITALWLTPLRALANDTALSLLEPVTDLNLNWTVQLRTGDTSQSLRKKQRERLPSALITTPESLTLLLSYPDLHERFASLKAVIVDEWHELLSTKRGLQTELALARLRTINPSLRTWGLSATLGNLPQAMAVLLGPNHDPAHAALITGQSRKDLNISTLIPQDIERFPWAGHLGTRSTKEVIAAINSARTTLLFTNTRSQAELWFQRLLTEAPDLLGSLAIHHGSLDRKVRNRVETLLAEGRLRCVVCTSSLDLGVDFAPVDQVLQVGSPKGVGRLLQRAGRSGHQPGATSRLLGVPAHAFELIEFAAAREAAQAGRVEPRLPIQRAIDVLVQHLVTVACADGFFEDDLKREVLSTHAYSNLSDAEWSWAMDFVRRGGPALRAYPHFARVTQTDAGRWIVPSERAARMHRLTIGTITGESTMTVKFASGRTLGHIEEGFIGRLTAGSRFVFGGRVLEILRVRDMTVFVTRARNKSGIVPRWDGGRFSLSTQLAAAVRAKLEQARDHIFDTPEMQAVKPLLDLQAHWSRIPAAGEMLVEHINVGGIHNLFLFPFQGRLAHEGMGALLAYRLSRRAPLTITSVVNDYGIGLRSESPYPHLDWPALLSTDNLLEDLAACLNSSNLARRQFRDIARIAGLIVRGYPGTNKPMRHLQASTEMFFDVFQDFDPDNLLLDQAKREVLDNQFEIMRLKAAMETAAAHSIISIEPLYLTPLSFPIWAEHLRATTLSSEKWADMVRRMILKLEEAASPTPRPPRKTGATRATDSRAVKEPRSPVTRRQTR
jgi:ATP-dependent helicase Lhr and Lhr-like helicase